MPFRSVIKEEIEKEKALRRTVYTHAEKIVPVVRIKPDHPKMNMNEIKMQMSVLAIDEKDYQKAEQLLKEVITQAKEPMTKLLALETLANIYRTTHNFRGLDLTLLQITRIRSHHDDHIERGNVLLILKRFGEAEKEYIQAIKMTMDKELQARCYTLAYLSSLFGGVHKPNYLIEALRRSPDVTIKMLKYLKDRFPAKNTKLFTKYIVDLMNRHEELREKLKVLVPVKVTG